MRTFFVFASFASLFIAVQASAGVNKKFETFVTHPRDEDENTQKNAIAEGMGGSKGSSVQYATDSTDGEEQAEGHGVRDKKIEPQSEDDEVLQSQRSMPEGGIGQDVEKSEQLQADEAAEKPTGHELGDEYKPTEEQAETTEEIMSPPSDDQTAPIIVGNENAGENSGEGKNVEIHNTNCGCLNEKNKKTDSKNGTNIAELKAAVGQLYDRAGKVKIIDEQPKIENMKDVEHAIGHLEEKMTDKKEEQATVAAVKNVDSEKKTESFRQVSAEKKKFTLKKMLRPHRFVQEDDGDDEDEDEETEREEAIDEAEEEVFDQKKEHEEEEKEEEDAPKKLSPAEAKAKLLENGRILERIIGNILSSNSGIPDLLGSKAREEYLKLNPPVSTPTETSIDEGNEEDEVEEEEEEE